MIPTAFHVEVLPREAQVLREHATDRCRPKRLIRSLPRNSLITISRQLRRTQIVVVQEVERSRGRIQRGNGPTIEIDVVGLGGAGGILRRIFSNLEKLDVVFLAFLYLAVIVEALHVV